MYSVIIGLPHGDNANNLWSSCQWCKPLVGVAPSPRLGSLCLPLPTASSRDLSHFGFSLSQQQRLVSPKDQAVGTEPVAGASPFPKLGPLCLAQLPHQWERPNLQLHARGRHSWAGWYSACGSERSGSGHEACPSSWTDG